jgi:serine/threonine protein kinase
MSDPNSPIFLAPELHEISALFPAYHIHGLIACGGMGAVYHATQISLDRLVAIKVLTRELSANDEFRSSFESEAKAMAKLNHSNLIGIYDFGEVDGMLFIVMEFVAGKSLFHSAHGLCVEQQQAVKLITDICHGLAHAHTHGILHRDIKPANILLDVHANPKLGDFGLARAQGYKVKEGEQIFGTVGYTAPEVLEPPFAFDARADIFSIGVMLHELLTGKLPEADLPPASQICGCHTRLDAVIAKCIQVDPGLRYSSANELIADLDAISSLPERPLVPLLKTPSIGNQPIVQKSLLSSQKAASFGSNRALALGVIVMVLGLVGYVASNEDSRKELLKLTNLIKNTVNSYFETPAK